MKIKGEGEIQDREGARNNGKGKSKGGKIRGEGAKDRKKVKGTLKIKGEGEM